MPISLIFIFFKNNNFDNLKNKFLIVAYFCLIAIGVILSGERTALIYYFIISFLFLFILFYLRKIFFLIILLFIIISSIFIIYDKDIKQRFFDTTIMEIGLNNNNQTYIFSEAHQKFYVTSFLMFKDNLIFGAGPNTYRKKCGEKKYLIKNKENNKTISACATHPHNSYMQLLAEAGIIATLFIIFLFILIMINLIKFYIKNKYLNNEDIIQVLLLITCFVSLFPFVPNGNFFNNWLSSLYFLPVGFLLIPHNNK